MLLIDVIPNTIYLFICQQNVAWIADGITPCCKCSHLTMIFFWWLSFNSRFIVVFNNKVLVIKQNLVFINHERSV